MGKEAPPEDEKSEDSFFMNRPKRLAILALVLVDLCLWQAMGRAEIPEALAVRAIMGEASGEGYTGMVAVGEALRNRGHLKGVYGLKAAHVDREPGWVWVQAKKAWRASKASNLTHQADHWENTKAFGEPYWAKSMVKTAQIGPHSFYRRSK